MNAKLKQLVAAAKSAIRACADTRFSKDDYVEAMGDLADYARVGAEVAREVVVRRGSRVAISPDSGRQPIGFTGLFVRLIRSPLSRGWSGGVG